MYEIVNNMEKQIPSSQMSWDRPFYYFNSQKWIPLIADEYPPSRGFNAVKVTINGQLQSHLNWKAERELAISLVEQGYALFWEIEMGFFSDLSMPLVNQTQYLSLGLSLDYFRDTLWKEFKHHSLGLVLYRGQADLSQSFPWDKQQMDNLRDWLRDRFLNKDIFTCETQLTISNFDEIELSFLLQSEIGKHLVRLFCRDVTVEYISLLASRLPDALPCYMLLDVSLIDNPLWQVQLLHPECFEKLNLAVKGSFLPLQAMGWRSSSPYGIIASESIPIPFHQEATIGVCLPSMEMCRPSQYEGLEEALRYLLAKNLPFRLISENHLTSEWDGLNELLYVPAGLSPQGKRKLQGFCAAGGTVITLSTKLGLPYEVSLFDFMRND